MPADRGEDRRANCVVLVGFPRVLLQLVKAAAIQKVLRGAHDRPILREMSDAPVSAVALPPDEAALLERLRRGEDQAYEDLIRAYGGRMLAVARRLLRNEEDAQDAVQEAFLGAFRNLSKFEGHSRVSTWLHRIVVNAALMKLRSKSRRPEQSIDELLPRFNSSGEAQELPRPWRSGVADALEDKESRQLVRDQIDRLPEAYRTVLLLRDIEELDTHETAELLQLSENAVKTRLHRARQALRTLLDAHFAGGGQ
jgi:RNA polymerase sigma-70 factor (ECF subfamily)